MSTPSNPFVRALAAVGTMGMSEVPAQFKAGFDTLKGAVSGKPFEGVASLAKGGSPMDALVPGMPQSPTFSNGPVNSPTTALATPASTIRARRNFSTLLTGSQGDTSKANVSKSTLLGGGNYSLGR